MAKLGERLREVRLERGYTQGEVARFLRMTRLGIWGIENGRRSVSAEELFKFAKLYGHSLEDFFQEKAREEDLIASFQAYGYPVLSLDGDRQGRIIEPTALILQVLREWPDPRFVEGLPVVIMTQKIGYEWLYREAVRLGLQNRLGLVVEITLEALRLTGVRKDEKDLRALLERLEKVRLEREEPFDSKWRGEDSRRLLRKLADPLSRKWRLLSNFPLETVTRWAFRVRRNYVQTKHTDQQS